MTTPSQATNNNRAAETRPWTRWWWMGSALTEAAISASLEGFQKAGIGGVEISPIYGPKGTEDRQVPWLSPRWIELLTHTLREADRLGMGVDLIAGTGWPFGGPMVAKNDAARRLRWVPAGTENTESDAELLTQTPDGSLFLGWTGQQVKRAAPGGEGLVLDHLNPDAVRRYLSAIGDALATLPADCPPLRAFFNDSWEVYGADATPTILDEWQKRRGYDPRPHLAALFAANGSDTARRLRADYRQTVGELVLDNFLTPFNAMHGLTRNQAHGSPGNLLDLYGAVDIPETEVFGPARLTKGGMTALAPAPPEFGGEEEALLCRMASSAAHVMGRPLTSSESFTWLGEHGHVPLSHARAEADMLFTLGINHLFFHGTAFSPPDAPWPGWQFYASTHFGPTNPWWRDLPAFNAYLTRCQAALQSGVPDNDVLLYFPYPELLHGTNSGETNDDKDQTLLFLSFHHTGKWLRGNLPAFADCARELTGSGWSFDLVSDRQLVEQIEADGRELAARNGGARWKAVMVAGCRLMPPETLERLIELAKSGATVLFQGALPEDVPGFGDLEARRTRLHAAIAALGEPKTHSGSGSKQYTLGDGCVCISEYLSMLMSYADIPREKISEAKIEWIRRRDPVTGTRTYFLSNPGTRDYSVDLIYPIEEEYDSARAVNLLERHRVPLHLPAGRSLILRIKAALLPIPVNNPLHLHGVGMPTKRSTAALTGTWSITFLPGGNLNPPPAPTALSTTPDGTLPDWTTLPGDPYRAFSGTATYTLPFDAPPALDIAKPLLLDLGVLLHSAQIRLNDTDLGTVFSRPYRVIVPPGTLKVTGNTLEIDATNLMANGLADSERRTGNAWRPFLMVDIFYKGFEKAIAGWEPLPSGLVGPVTLGTSP